MLEALALLETTRPSSITVDQNPANTNRHLRAGFCTLMLTDELRYKLMRVLQKKPHMSQRELARELGISLGKANYCLQALIKRGLVKAKNFQNSKNKAAYIYLLTPRGLEQKTALAVRYLKAKTAEYEELRAEIARLKREIDSQNSNVDLTAS